MQIILHFSNLRKPYQVQINLFDHPVVQRWFDFFRSNHCTHRCISQCNLHDVYTADPDRVDQAWQVILKSCARLTELGYRLPFQLGDRCDYQQSTTNMLHRFFTYNAMWYRESHLPNPFDPGFALPDISYAEWLSYIDPINLSVHNIEVFYDNPHRQWVRDHAPVESLRLVRDFSPTDWDKDSWLQFSQQEQEFARDRLDYDQGWPVMLDQCILGRSYYDSFLQCDDPSARDCTGRLGSYGGLEIDINQGRQRVYDSDIFKCWLAQHGVDAQGLPLEFQIGWVDTNTDLGFQGGRLVSVEFV